MKRQGIKFVSGCDIHEPLMNSCANLYCQIWREPPWNEDFWQAPRVANDFRKLLRNKKAAVILAVDGDDVIGFTSGYLVSKSGLRRVSGGVELDCLFDDGLVFYVVELGVSRGYRGKSVGHQLSERLLEQANSLGAVTAALRTEVLATPARRLYKNLGFIELAVRDKRHPGRTYWRRVI